jgi:thiol-disulfide isomerase/thioredoxin
MSQARTTSRMAILIPAVLLLFAWFVVVKAPKLQGGGGGDKQGHPSLFQTTTFADAKAASLRDSSYLLVDLTASWCPPCRMMEQDTWPDPRIAEWVSQHGSAIQIDIDADRDTATELQIKAIPTLVLFKDGKELDRKVGYVNADGLLEWLNGAAR